MIKNPPLSMKNVTLTLVMILTILPVRTAAYAQAPGTSLGGGFGGSADGSRFPFRVKLSGTLNPTTLNEHRIKVAKLSINGFREMYQFEIIQAEAVDDKQVLRTAIVPSVTVRGYDFLVVGTKDLLSKIGQSLPNTPVTLTGYLRQNRNELILETVETIRLDGLSSPDHEENAASPAAPADSVD